MHRMRDHLLNAVLVLGCLSAPVALAQDRPSGGVLFENVRIFNGTTGRLSGPSNVLVVGNVIRTISSASMAGSGRRQRATDPGRGTHADARTHRQPLAHDAGPAVAGAGDRWRRRLSEPARRGGGPGHPDARLHDRAGSRRTSLSFKQAIDAGLIPGPRIYPSGAMITTSGGHGDLRHPTRFRGMAAS